jgi:hypothetical protein
VREFLLNQGLKLLGMPKEMREIVLKVWQWLNGKKVAIGGILYVLADITSGLLLLFPVLQKDIVELGVPEPTVAAIFMVLTRVFIYVGVIHKAWKKWMNVDDPATTPAK